MTQIYDLLVVGGGINGVSIAADGAGRGLTTLLVEMNDLASATSSASSKLLHGGLRYLEHYEFRLVREALAEREVLLKMAPHIASPMRFRLPHRPHLRPAWMIRIGLFLYDHLGKRVTLPSSHGVNFGARSPLKPEITKGFEYSDCWVDDARLVVLNAKLAQEQGGEIRTRTKCVGAHRDEQAGVWLVELEDTLTGERSSVQSKALVNAAGPWVARLFDQALAQKSPRSIRLIKGSHIIVPKVHHESQAYILQNEDNRIVFVIPFLEDLSIIGTTDVEHQGEPNDVTIDEQEISYLIDVVNAHFNKQLVPEDVVSTYSGVRPLCDDESDSPSAITRDYTIEVDDLRGSLPLLSVFGGKLTTYRKLGEAALAKLEPYFPEMARPWTAGATLPGGDFYAGCDVLGKRISTQYPWLPVELVSRYVKAYGTRTFDVLRDCQALNDLGQDLGHGLYTREVDYLRNHEWAKTVDDILWRRTKLGLFFDHSQRQALQDYLTEQPQSDTTAQLPQAS